MASKFSIKVELIPLASNELLDCPSSISFNARLVSLNFISQALASLFTRSVPNARINPAGRIVSAIQALRMEIKLIRLGLNELFGGVATCRRIEPNIQPSIFQPKLPSRPPLPSNSPDGLRQLPPFHPARAPFKSTQIQSSMTAISKTRCGGHR